MVASRLGSLLIEPLYKKLRIVKYASYEDFKNAEKTKDKDKLNLLLEQNNMYRTMVGVFIISIVGKPLVPFMTKNALVFFIILIVIFSLSYRKQTSYIRKRVEKDNRDQKKEES